MNDQIFKLLLLFAAFRSFSCLEHGPDSIYMLAYRGFPGVTEYGKAKIGEKCERDRNCIQNAYCRAQMTCLCDQYYSPTLDNSMCIASVGLSCSDDLACSTMTNAMCRQGACACKDSYILDINNSSNCIKRPTIEGDYCQRTDICQDVFDRAMCINERCQCITTYHFVNQTGKCIQTRFLYNSCKMDYDCKDSDVTLECRNGICLCKKGEPTCSKGSTLTIGILLMLLPFIHKLNKSYTF